MKNTIKDLDKRADSKLMEDYYQLFGETVAEFDEDVIEKTVRNDEKTLDKIHALIIQKVRQEATLGADDKIVHDLDDIPEEMLMDFESRTGEILSRYEDKVINKYLSNDEEVMLRVNALVVSEAYFEGYRLALEETIHMIEAMKEDNSKGSIVRVNKVYDELISELEKTILMNKGK